MSQCRLHRLVPALIGLFLLAGCAAKGKVADGVKPLIAASEPAAAELLDVAIVVFDFEELSDDELEEQGLSEEIRQAEARFIPLHLKYAMQRSGYWGVVRVVPTENDTDVLVQGTINHSNGELLSLDIVARDARGVEWFRKTYAEEVEVKDHEKIVPEQQDSFQDLYNSVANDLAEHRQALTADEVREIQQISEMRFANRMAPAAFSGYFEIDEEGRYRLQHLPVDDDPMLGRVRAVQVRDEMLIDTVNNYYDIYYQDLWQPYADWRRLRSEEAEALKEIEKQALTRKLLGLAAIVGGVALSSGNGNLSNSNLPSVMVIGGAAAIYSGFQKSAETKIHKEAIEELSVSFAAEAEPLVVDVVGETVRLTGSAEEQYAQWRELLRDIYHSETGLPLGDSPPDDIPTTEAEPGAFEESSETQ